MHPTRFLPAIISACLTLNCPQALALKVVTWNVWNGFDGGRTAPAAGKWLAGQKPDLVALQELNGQTPEGLAELAKGWGHPHSALLKQDGYPVGISSREPIEVLARHREGMSHGCLQVRTAGHEVFVVHLHPGDWSIREREMKILSGVIRPLVDAGRPVIVLGDFNSHSPADRSFLSGQARLLEQRRGANLRDGNFDFAVMQGFLDTGLHDPSSVAAPGNRTFPTRILDHVLSVEKQALYLERIDFILADPATVANCRELRYPADPELDAISDHYPVVARFEAGAPPFRIVDPATNPFPQEPRRDLSVNVGGGKGVLIAPHWVLTASHCIASRHQGVVTVSYPAPDGGKVSIKSDKVIRHGSVDLALVRLTKPARGRIPLLVLKDGFPVSGKDQPPYRLRKVASNAAWDDIPARVSPKAGGERFYVSRDQRHGKAGTSGSPWVIRSPLVGDVLVGITHGTGRIPQVGRACGWIEQTVNSLSEDRILWATPHQALPPVTPESRPTP